MAALKVLDAEPLGEDVADKLRAALEKAEAGELSSVAIAVVYRDGSTGWWRSEAPNSALQIGAVGMLHWRLCDMLAE